MAGRKIVTAGLLLLLAAADPTFAKEGKLGSLYYEAGVKYGALNERIPKESVSAGDRIFLHEITAGAGFQTRGDKYWQQFFGCPKYGLRVSYIHYGKETYGYNIGIYPYLQGPIAKYRGFSLEYGIGAGFAWHSRTGDPVKNPDNIFINHPFMGKIDISILAVQRISSRVDILGGFNFAHHSTGHFSIPNRGTNGFSGTLGVQIHTERDSRMRTLPQIAKPDFPRNEVHIMIAPARAEAALSRDFSDKKPFFCATGQLGYMRRFHPNMKYGAGLDLFYYGFLNYMEETPDAPKRKNFSGGIYGNYELMFGNFSLHLAVGHHILFPGKKVKRGLYERVGMYYNFGKNDNQFAGIALKAKRSSAEYLEFSYGYRIFRK